MQYKEIIHSLDVMDDIRNEFVENIHTLIYLSDSVYDRLRKNEKIYRIHTHLDINFHYDDSSIISLSTKYDDGRIREVIGITKETGNMYMIVYYDESVYFGKRQKVREFYSVVDAIERIVYIK